MARNPKSSKLFMGSRIASPNSSRRAATNLARSRHFRKLKIEPLEQRRMLATFTVTTLNDTTVTGPGSAPGTFRQAIYDANVSGDADIIDFAPGLSGDLRISIVGDSAIGLSALLVTTPITVRGNAAGITIKRDITAPSMRFFRVAVGGNLTLDSLNITGGITIGMSGASGQNGGPAYAGAIYNQGNLEIIASTLYNNTAIGGDAGAGGDSGAGQGGAVFNDGGTVSIRNSTFSGNSASNGTGPLVARSSGGGVYTKNGSLGIYNSTITNGNAASGRDLYIIGIGAGQTARAEIYSSIIAQADASSTVFDINATFDFGGHIDVTGANNIIRRQNDYQLIAVSSDDPLLGTLANNGGPTLTHALLTGSPAIGQGSNLLNLATDQRGVTYSRAVGAADIGAFELQTGGIPELLGDYNGNQSVDAGDYVLWRKSFGADVPPYSGADGNGSSKIDAADYDVWRGHFGAAPASAATAAVVESASIAVTTDTVVPDHQSKDGPLLAGLATHGNILTSPPERRIQTRRREVQAIQTVDLRLRDEALLAIMSEQFAPRAVNGDATASEHNSALDFRQTDSNFDPRPMEVALIQALRQTVRLAAASTSTA